MCNDSFIIHLHRISGEKKRKKERKRGEKSVDQTGFELGAVGL